jgi:hypothetical protein
MRIGKPLLITTTVAGVTIGVIEAFRLAGALGLIVVVLISLFAAAMTWIYRMARAEQRAESVRREPGGQPGDQVDRKY